MSKINNPTEADRLRAALRLPQRSSEYHAAEKTSKQAAANHRALAGRREALRFESTFVDNPVRAKLTDGALEAAMNCLDVEIAEAKNAEQTAFAEFHKLRSEYQAHCAAALQSGVESLNAALGQRFDEILQLLEAAAELSGQAREAGVTLPAVVMDAPVALRLAETMVGTLSRTISKGSRS